MTKDRSGNTQVDQLLRVIRGLTRLVVFLLLMLFLLPVIGFFGDDLANALTSLLARRPGISIPVNDEEGFWNPPDIEAIDGLEERKRVAYGKEIIAHTARYLGPSGTIATVTNGMNCQNCHLEAGTKIFGNNYSAVAANYPKFRARSGTIEDIYKRVNDCLERSLNGQPLDTASQEMQAIKAYIEFVGVQVPKGEKPDGAGLVPMPYLDRAADADRGKVVFDTKCARCHQPNGQGQKTSDGREYLYPPLWGPHSYNDAAGLYRVTNFARYVKVNMPQGATHRYPMLTDEEAYDVAAFVNSQPRPHKSVPRDWPDITKKPVDHPFGPYADTFTEYQHKYGPWPPIEKALKNLAEQKRKSDAR